LIFIDVFCFFHLESLIKPLKKTKLSHLQFGRRYADLSNPQQAKKEKYFHSFLNVILSMWPI